MRTISTVVHHDKNPHDLAKTGIVAAIGAILQGDDTMLAMHGAELVSGLTRCYFARRIFISKLCDACVIPHIVRLLGSGVAPAHVEETVAAALHYLTRDSRLHK